MNTKTTLYLTLNSDVDFNTRPLSTDQRDGYTFTATINSIIPEPGTIALLGLGVLLLPGRR